MALRLHEIHPSVVHFPLTLIPMALGLDAIGAATDNQGLMKVGRSLMAAGAASAVVAGVFGYVAQGAVNTDARARELLTTHRNMNTVLVAAAGVMAVMRSRRRRPGIGYLLGGLGAVAAMTYTAYLGGKMVYAHRVGVEPDGVRTEESPEVVRGSIGGAASAAMRHAVQQLRSTVREMRRGEIAPALRKHAEQLPSSTPPS